MLALNEGRKMMTESAADLHRDICCKGALQSPGYYVKLWAFVGHIAIDRRFTVEVVEKFFPRC